MADITYGFYPSLNGDRVYDWRGMSGFIKSMVENGVFEGQMAVVAKNGMTIEISPGRIWIEGHFYFIDKPISLTLNPTPSNRTDRIIMRHSEGDRMIEAAILEGANGQNYPRTLTRDQSTYEMCLAEISLRNSTSVITQSMIVDTRPDVELCGYTGPPGKRIDTSTWDLQMKGLLSDVDALLRSLGEIEAPEKSIQYLVNLLRRNLPRSIMATLSSNITLTSKAPDSISLNGFQEYLARLDERTVSSIEALEIFELVNGSAGSPLERGIKVLRDGPVLLSPQLSGWGRHSVNPYPLFLSVFVTGNGNTRIIQRTQLDKPATTTSEGEGELQSKNIIPVLYNAKAGDIITVAISVPGQGAIVAGMNIGTSLTIQTLGDFSSLPKPGEDISIQSWTFSPDPAPSDLPVGRIHARVRKV